MTKEAVQADLWLKDVAPSTPLRKWFGHDRLMILQIKPFLAVFLLITVSGGAFLSASVQGQTPMEKSLYERLGGYDAVSAVVDEFAGKLFNDPVVGARFFGMSDDSREGFRQKNKNLVCNVTGGPCKIISRSAAKTHDGLGRNTMHDLIAGLPPSSIKSCMVFLPRLVRTVIGVSNR